MRAQGDGHADTPQAAGEWALFHGAMQLLDVARVAFDEIH